MNRDTLSSPQRYARIGGVLYLIIIITGLFGELFVREKLIAAGDAAATAHNILASEPLWRLGIAGDLLMHLCDVPLMLIFYVLLRPVSKNLALLSLLFTAIQTAVLVAFKLKLLEALFLLKNTIDLDATGLSQVQTIAYSMIRAEDYGFGIGLLFFGFTCLITGYLIRKSGYLPKLIGWLMQIAGVCYIINTTLLIFGVSIPGLPDLAILIPSFVGEFSFCLWLIFKGVNVSKWNEAASDHSRLREG